MIEAEAIMEVAATTGEVDDDKQPVKRAFSMEDLQEYRKFVKSHEPVSKKHNELMQKKREDLLKKYGKDGKYDDAGLAKANAEFVTDKELLASAATEHDYEVTDKFKALVKKAFDDFKFDAGDLAKLDIMDKFK